MIEVISRILYKQRIMKILIQILYEILYKQLNHINIFR